MQSEHTSTQQCHLNHLKQNYTATDLNLRLKTLKKNIYINVGHCFPLNIILLRRLILHL